MDLTSDASVHLRSSQASEAARTPDQCLDLIVAGRTAASLQRLYRWETLVATLAVAVRMTIQEIAEQDVTEVTTMQPCSAAVGLVLTKSMAPQELADKDEMEATTMQQSLGTVVDTLADQLVAFDKGGAQAATMPQAATEATHTANQEVPDKGVMAAATMRLSAATAMLLCQLGATAMVAVVTALTTRNLWVMRYALFS